MCHTVTNLTMSLLRDIPTFDGWDTTKLEDWLKGTEMATDILKQNQAHLANAKSNILIQTLICQALKAGKCWDDIRYMLHLKLSNANMNTYKSHFIENQQRDNDTQAAYVYHFKTEDKRCDFNSDTSCHLYLGLQDAHIIVENICEKDPQTL